MFTTKSTFNEILQADVFREYSRYFLENCNVPDLSLSLEKMHELFDDWEPRTIVDGLNALEAATRSNRARIFDLPNSAVLFMMSAGEPDKPFALICPGGGYEALCHLKEGFPVAAAFNRLGYNAFILNYRIIGPALFPKPLEDIAAAVRFILSNAKNLGVRADNYAVVGFSAGGHLVSSFATEELGAKNFGLPAPACVMCGYPMLEVRDTSEVMHSICVTMFGEGFTTAQQDEYSLISRLLKGVPPFYIFHCKDDPIIAFEDSQRAVEKMQKENILCGFKAVEHGGHGFGLGDYGEAAGWLEEAVGLWKQACSK